MLRKSWLISAMTALCACAGSAPCPRGVASPPASSARAAPGIEIVSPPAHGFYAKRLDAGGIFIEAHASVSDEAVLAARARLDRLLTGAPGLRRNFVRANLELHVMGKYQLPSDLPEMRDDRGTRLENGELFDDHMRGGHLVDRFVSCTEGVLLGFVTDVHFGDDSCTHELGHAVEFVALGPAGRARILETFRRAMEARRFQGDYAARDHAEYFAELSRYYFQRDGLNAHVRPELARGQSWLRDADPDGFALVDALYTGALDPGEPRTVRLPLASPSPELAPRSVEGRVPTTIAVENRRSSPIDVAWIDYEGKRDAARKRTVLPGRRRVLVTFATHPFLILDGETTLGVITATEDFGVVVVEGSAARVSAAERAVSPAGDR